MSLSQERLEAEVPGLPVGQRARLARRLIESLDEDAIENPRPLEHAREEEIERRSQEYRDGTTGAVPASEIIAEARDSRALGPRESGSVPCRRPRSVPGCG